MLQWLLLLLLLLVFRVLLELRAVVVVGFLASRVALEGRVAGVRVVGVLPERAGARAEDEPPLGQEGATQEGQVAARAAEAGLRGVPVLPLIRHLALVYT